MLNTEKLELPSISQVHTRGPADVLWSGSHTSQRPILSGDRLPDLHLPQTYTSSATFTTNSSRAGGSDHSSNGQDGQYSPPHISSYSSKNSGIGLRTPSPSPISQNRVPPPHELLETRGETSEYSQPSQQTQPYAQSTDHYSSAMNPQHQYLDSQQPHMSGGQSYAPPSTTAGGMSQYSSYQQQQQPPVLHPSPGSYAPAPAAYGQYAYSNGMTSPHTPGHPVSSSIGSQINQGLLPLPSESLSF